MLPSSFSPILAQLVRDLPGADGAIFVDWEGEAVDKFDGTERETPIRLIGAHWGIIYYLFRNALDKINQGDPKQLVLGFQAQTYVISQVTSEYLMVVTMASRVNMRLAMDMSRITVQRLRREM